LNGVNRSFDPDCPATLQVGILNSTLASRPAF
jgi:hypothetical protein